MLCCQGAIPVFRKRRARRPEKGRPFLVALRRVFDPAREQFSRQFCSFSAETLFPPTVRRRHMSLELFVLAAFSFFCKKRACGVFSVNAYRSAPAVSVSGIYNPFFRAVLQ
jgi:hypothetical protein